MEPSEQSTSDASSGCARCPLTMIWLRSSRIVASVARGAPGDAYARRQKDFGCSLEGHPADQTQTQRPASPRRSEVVGMRVRVALRVLRHARACEIGRAFRR